MPRSKTSAAGARSGTSGLYKTANLNFAAYLHATGRLEYDHAEPNEK